MVIDEGGVRALDEDVAHVDKACRSLIEHMMCLVNQTCTRFLEAATTAEKYSAASMFGTLGVRHLTYKSKSTSR